MRVVSVRKHPEAARDAITFFQKYWADENSVMVYEDCILSCLSSSSPLPQWYLLYQGETIVGGAGLVTNDFVSRMDLWPWLCALYVEEEYRGHGYAGLLIKLAKNDAKHIGYPYLYLCTDLVGYYERHGFEEMACGYHPWGECTNIFRAEL